MLLLRKAEKPEQANFVILPVRGFFPLVWYAGTIPRYSSSWNGSSRFFLSKANGQEESLVAASPVLELDVSYDREEAEVLHYGNGQRRTSCLLQGSKGYVEW